jgi:hypothetical protein
LGHAEQFAQVEHARPRAAVHFQPAHQVVLEQRAAVLGVELFAQRGADGGVDLVDIAPQRQQLLIGSPSRSK